MTRQPPSLATLAFIPYSDAISARAAHSRWAAAKERLQPEVWPVLRPSFKFEAGATIFSTGSCFARNIEEVLLSLGFKIPTRTSIQTPEEMDKGAGGGIINKYTPAAIAQEIRWASEIFKRDDAPRPEDFEIFAYELADGSVVDNNLMGFVPVSRARFIERRIALYGVVKSAFSADVAIITPGLVEAWYDAARNIFIQQTFTQRIPHITDNLRFTSLNFAQCFDYLDLAVADIRELNPRCKFLITTSPVPLGVTFTQDDVIVANARAKATLRAACGELVGKWRDADYFPSFETVTYTRDWSIFAEDLQHVKPSFVTRIMGRVVEAYCGTEVLGDGDFKAVYDTSDHDAALAATLKSLQREPDSMMLMLRHIELLFDLGRASEAFDVGLGYMRKGTQSGTFAHRLCAVAVKMAEDGKEDDALKALQDIMQVVPGHGEVRWRLATVLTKLGRLEEAIVELDQAVPLIKSSSPRFFEGVVIDWVTALRKSGRLDEAIAAAQHLTQGRMATPRLYVQCALSQRQKGDLDGAIKTLQACLQVSPNYEMARNRLDLFLTARNSKAGAISRGRQRGQNA